MTFHSKLRFEEDPGGGLPFTLFEPLVYESDLLRRSIVVPAGFRTDLASIPRGLWNVLPPVGGYDAPAVIHDYLYQFNGVTRGEADRVLREAMEGVGVSRIVRWLIFSGVRAGGWVTWNRYRKGDGR